VCSFGGAVERVNSGLDQPFCVSLDGLLPQNEWNLLSWTRFCRTQL
jgi:hypothetical protein